MQKKILLTRPRAASERWATLLARHGFTSFVEPLLTIESLASQRPEGLFQASVITSANALDALETAQPALADLLPLPCFCVGAATGEAARRFGFTDIRCGVSDSAALAHKIAATLTDKNRPLLHIGADISDDKTRAILARKGFTLTLWAVYHARAADDLTRAARDALRDGEIAAVLVFSPRSARILVSLLEKNGLSAACRSLIAVSLSQAVADVLKILPWQRLRVAALPSEEEVLNCLQRETSMTQIDPPPGYVPDVTPDAASVTPGRLRSKIFFVWMLLGALLLVIAGADTLLKCPWLYPPPAIHAKPATDSAALEQRVEALEKQFAALAPIPAVAAPQAGANDASMADTVKNLQAQMAQMQNQGRDSQQAARRLVAAAFAFWDLRDTARSGRSFAAPLATLRAASGGDTGVDEQIAKLEPYATTPPPTLPQLRATLATQEAALPPPAAAGTSASLWERLKTIAQPLVSVHPLHNPSFAALENALDSGDAREALVAFKTLPDDTQNKLAPWRAGLEARATIDEALRALGVSFTDLAAAESKP